MKTSYPRRYHPSQHTHHGHDRARRQPPVMLTQSAKPPNSEPLPTTSMEPICGAMATVVRRRRVRAGLSPNQLAARTKLSRQGLNFVESAEGNPTLNTLARIGRAFGVRPSRLLSEAEALVQL